MWSRVLFAAIGVLSLSVPCALRAQPPQRLNPMIDLLEQKKPIFGLYAPTAGRGGAASAQAPVVKTPLDLAREALAYKNADFIFSGSMEGNIDRGLPAFAEFAAAMREAGALTKNPFPRLTHPLSVKTPSIAADTTKAIDNISRQLNLGVNVLVFVKVESADELRRGLAAMRFKSKGGTRPDPVGTAPAYWGMTEQQYREKADLWPLNPNGELVNWTIVESREGLANLDSIASVKGIGVLVPGAGTLRGVFRGDPEGAEAAIQQVLAACKKYNIPCGYPATENDIELRMKQGFSVFIMNWGEAGFRTVDIGRRVGGR